MHKIEAILQRARLYKLPLWQYQSLPLLDPYLLASQGYTPLPQNTLQCHICLHQVSYGEEPEEVADLEQQLSQHKEDCIYLGQSSDQIGREDLYMSMEYISQELNQRSKNEKYPILQSDAIWNYTKPHNYMLKKVMGLYQIDRDNFNISFFLRLFGWYFSHAQEEPCLTCYFCGQSVLLKEIALTTQLTQKREAEVNAGQELLFNPVQEHRYFCFWVGSQQNWLVLLQNLEDKFLEGMSFRLKVEPLSMKKMKIHIDKYLEGFNQKMEMTVGKLKQVGQEFDKICEGLREQNQAEISEDNLSQGKRLGALCDQADEWLSKLKNQPSKKIKDS